MMRALHDGWVEARAPAEAPRQLGRDVRARWSDGGILADRETGLSLANFDD